MTNQRHTNPMPRLDDNDAHAEDARQRFVNRIAALEKEKTSVVAAWKGAFGLVVCRNGSKTDEKTVERFWQLMNRFAGIASPDAVVPEETPIPMILHCPKCQHQHVDAPEPEKGWFNPPHRKHLCHNCANIWKPANVATDGVLGLTEIEHDT